MANTDKVEWVHKSEQCKLPAPVFSFIFFIFSTMKSISAITQSQHVLDSAMMRTRLNILVKNTPWLLCAIYIGWSFSWLVSDTFSFASTGPKICREVFGWIEWSKIWSFAPKVICCSIYLSFCESIWRDHIRDECGSYSQTSWREIPRITPKWSEGYNLINTHTYSMRLASEDGKEPKPTSCTYAP